MNPLLSILTPALPSRFDKIVALSEIIATQIAGAPVEHLVLLDNKQRTVGQKRDALLRISRGDYVAFVDDDDMIAPDYVAEILRKIALEPDVITFQQMANVDGSTALIDFGLQHDNQPFVGTTDLKHLPVIKRGAWHICAWRRLLAIQSHFPAVNYGEDWAFAEPLCKLAQSEQHIDKVLHYYRHSSKLTEAPHPSSFVDSLEPYPASDTFHAATGH